VIARPLGVAGVGVVALSVVALALPASPAHAAPAEVAPSPSSPAAAHDDGVARFVLILGVNRSVDPDLPVLRYADDDAARYEELFRSIGGKTTLLARLDDNTRRIAPEAVALARVPRRAELTRALATLAADVSAAHARGQRTLFYFVYAGHGNVSGNAAYLALEDARLDAKEIEHEIIDKVHADESHLIIDACYSYFLAFGRGPGGRRRVVPSFATAEGLAGRRDVGLLLSTTSARESHEWGGFQAGIFSHEVRSGLYGAADLDGDGRISYLEIAAFVSRANAAIPNERFRPEVYAHAPLAASELVDLRAAPGRRLRLDATAQVGHYLFEDTLGVRLADFHNARGHALSVLLPSSAGPLYLRRASEEQEYAIPPAPDVINLADLSPQPARALARGPADYAFNLIFSLPFDDEAVAAYSHDSVRVADDSTVVDEAATPAVAPLPRWRKNAGTAALGLAAVSASAAFGWTVAARQASQEARAATSQQATADFNQRLADRRRWAEVSYGIAGAALLGGAWLLFGPRGTVQPQGAFDSRSGSGTIGVTGDF
jgi:hypothetical protein